MWKNAITAVAVSVAILGVGAQAASAQWYDKGTALKAGENPSLGTTGEVAFTSPNGGVNCNSGIATLQFTGGTTEGHLTAFGVENAANCEITGGLVFLCGGTTQIEKVVSTGFAKLSHSGNAVHISSFTVHYYCKNGYKLTLVTIVSSPPTIVPDNTRVVTRFTLSGAMSSALGNVTLSGLLNVLAPNSGTYGLTP